MSEQKKSIVSEPKLNFDALFIKVRDYCFDHCEHMVNSEKYHQCSISEKNTCQIWDFLRYCNNVSTKQEVSK